MRIRRLFIRKYFHDRPHGQLSRLGIANEKLEIFWKFRKEILNCRENFPTFSVIWFNRTKYWSQSKNILFVYYCFITPSGKFRENFLEILRLRETFSGKFSERNFRLARNLRSLISVAMTGLFTSLFCFIKKNGPLFNLLLEIKFFRLFLDHWKIALIRSVI